MGIDPSGGIAGILSVIDCDEIVEPGVV